MPTTNYGMYSSLISTFIAANGVNGQIQYVDIDPDTIAYKWNQYELNDLVANISITFGVYGDNQSINAPSYQSSWLYNQAYVITAGVMLVSGSTAAAANLSSGSLIGPSANFTPLNGAAWLAEYNHGYLTSPYTSIFTPFSSTNATGEFIGVNDGYMGFWFQMSGNTHYGWVRIGVHPDADTIVIKDYAYNLTPNDPIIAGQTVSTPENDFAEKVIFNCAPDQTKLLLTPDMIGANAIIMDPNGKILMNESIDQSEFVIQYTQLPLGVYFLSVQKDGQAVSKKIYVAP